MQMSDVDDFDFICHIAYDQKPLTRRERADGASAGATSSAVTVAPRAKSSRPCSTAT